MTCITYRLYRWYDRGVVQGLLCDLLIAEADGVDGQCT
jgi:hypothetical protein